MIKKPNIQPEKSVREKPLNSFGSELNETGWKPGERTLLAPGTIGPQLRTQMRFEKSTADMASEQPFGGSSNESTEFEIMEGAIHLVCETRRSVYTAKKFDQQDVVDAAGAYIESCVAEGRFKCLLETLPYPSSNSTERKSFYVAVYEVIRLYAEGLRLTPHLSGDAYEGLRVRFVAL